jgi:hypothetical protein
MWFIAPIETGGGVTVGGVLGIAGYIEQAPASAGAKL